MPSTHPHYEPSAGEHSPRRHQASAFDNDVGSTPARNFTHRVVRENPQLAAPVAVQFQNSEAHLFAIAPRGEGELFQNPVTHGRLVVALLPEALAFHDQR